ncbi:MAG: hypothetical protein HY261_02560, partial [Chloroflexi bacterium]|nr:hypothetical protein [Chloroflexota bacterium]
MVNKDTGSVIVRADDPAVLLGKLEAVYRERLLPRYVQVMNGHNPDGELND